MGQVHWALLLLPPLSLLRAGRQSESAVWAAPGARVGAAVTMATLPLSELHCIDDVFEIRVLRAQSVPSLTSRKASALLFLISRSTFGGGMSLLEALSKDPEGLGSATP